MIDLISQLVESALPLLISLGVAALGAVGVFVYGRKKKAEGKEAERRRAEQARAEAAAKAAKVRETAAKTPVEQQRKEVSRWER